MAKKDSLATVGPRRRLLASILAGAALGSAAAGAVVGSGDDDDQPAPRAGATAGAPRSEAPRDEPSDRRAGPAVPRAAARQAAALPLERKVQQLFVLGFTGTDLNAAVFVRLREQDLGGIVIGPSNYSGADLLGQMAGEAAVIAEDEGHIRPWVMVSQEGGELNSFPDLPPPTAPVDLPSAQQAGTEAAEAAGALADLGVTGVMGPVLDVGFEGSTALESRVYSDDAADVAAFADAVVPAYRAERLFATAQHFPGLGSADQSTREGPATVGLGLPELRRRDLRPFRAALGRGLSGVVLSHALYPMNDFTAPASMSREVATDLLRGELRFSGVAMTDDLADPAVTAVMTPARAAVAAVRAGTDMLYVSGPVDDQDAAMSAVLAAARTGRISRARVNQAVGRVLAVKAALGLIG